MKVEKRIDPWSMQNVDVALKTSLKFLEERQKYESDFNQYKKETTVVLETNDFPLIDVHTGDNHLTHIDSHVYSLVNTVKFAGEDGLVHLHGNIIDSVSNKFLNTNTINVLSLDHQTAIAKAILKQLTDDQRLVAVGANFCHEGWTMKTSTHDSTRDYITPETPLLYNGGQTILKEKIIKKSKGKEVENIVEVGRIESYHNSGKGNTIWSPEGSARQRGREIPFGDPRKPDVLVDAHTHQLVACVDVSVDPMDGKNHRTVLGQVGAAKGNEEMPDRFTNALGVAPRNQPGDKGEGLVIVWRKDKKGEVVPYPVADFDRARLICDAEKLYEATLRTGTYNEIFGEMMASGKFKTPEKELIIEDCRERVKDYAANSSGEAPIYKTVSYEIKTGLPVRVHFIGNTRVGSSSFERSKLKSDLLNINSDPFAFYFATRRLINQSTNKSAEREKILSDLSELLGLASTSALGIMLTDELINKGWKKEIKVDKVSVSESVLPGDYLYFKSKMSGVPILDPEVAISLNLKQTQRKEFGYDIYLRDKLQGHTSKVNPFHGLARVAEIYGIKADLLVGGHTPIVGFRTRMMSGKRPEEIIVPGGYAEYTEMGAANRCDYPSGGQGSIIFPNEKRIYSFPTFEECRDIHEALVLYKGLEKLGTLPKIRRALEKK